MDEDAYGIIRPFGEAHLWVLREAVCQLHSCYGTSGSSTRGRE